VGEGREFSVVNERHYRLVPPSEVSEKDLNGYRSLPE
jgi:hypothetical protein